MYNFLEDFEHVKIFFIKNFRLSINLHFFEAQMMLISREFTNYKIKSIINANTFSKNFMFFT